MGQMCHIVARSKYGPRGTEPLDSKERGDYDNLILLCRNDHGIIDNDVNLWPVSRLVTLKIEHETWVTEQLSKSTISVSEVDISDYLITREKKWRSMNRDKPMLAISLTPLKISDDVLISTDPALIRILNKAKISDYEIPSEIFSRLLRLSPHGVRNESLETNQ